MYSKSHVSSSVFVCPSKQSASGSVASFPTLTVAPGVMPPTEPGEGGGSRPLLRAAVPGGPVPHGNAVVQWQIGSDRHL